jgi:hypothetical protein
MKIDGIEVHRSITVQRVCNAVEAHNVGLEDPGFCLACGADAFAVEPDAEHYECEICGEKAVFGASNLLVYIA